MRRWLISAFLTAAVISSGCLVTSVDRASHRGHGPPPHAPAHGYRQKHAGTELAFDSKLGVYLVLGHSNRFYSDGRFLRLHEDSWQVSASLEGPWSAYPAASVPPGLRGTHPAETKRGKHKAHPPAKRRW